MQKIYLLIFISFLIISCSEDSTNTCFGVKCKNYQVCNNDVCECEEGFYGESCEIDKRAFLTTWKTDNEGVSEDNQVKIVLD